MIEKPKYSYQPLLLYFWSHRPPTCMESIFMTYIWFLGYFEVWNLENFFEKIGNFFEKIGKILWKSWKKSLKKLEIYSRKSPKAW